LQIPFNQRLFSCAESAHAARLKIEVATVATFAAQLYAKRSIFTCNSATEELGEKAMLLRDALGVTRGEMAALIGAGDKTTTMFRLAKELHDQGWKILITTTTQLVKPTKPHIDRLFLVDELQALVDACAGIAAPVVIGAACGVSQEGKLLGMPVTWLDRLNQDQAFDAILVQADGATRSLLKIPSEGEPLIPQSCQTTLWIVAVKVLGKSFTDDWVAHSTKARDLLGLPANAYVSEDILIQLLEHQDGCLKGIPAASRKVALINRADSPAEMTAAQELGKKLQTQGFERVVITSYASTEPVIHGLTS
jgi:probable selenium-dependent hydroxylase accessory protein YqeC